MDADKPIYIMHIALGGCLTAPPVRYGLTEDTGGHIAYVLGAAAAQCKRADVGRVEIVTRAFDDPVLGVIHAQTTQILGPKLRIRRLSTQTTGYLSKRALADAVSALEVAFLECLAAMDVRPDVIHAHFSDAARLARAAGTAFAIPHVYTPHSLALDKQQCGLSSPDRLRVAQERAALAGADAVIVSSRDEAEAQVEAYGAGVSGRVHRINPGVDAALAEVTPAEIVEAEALIAPWLADPSLPIILAIARPVAKKNLALLVRAFADDPTLRRTANLVILAGQHDAGLVGDPDAQGVLGGIRDAIAAGGLERSVAFPPAHGPRTVAALYRIAARGRGVFVNPALHEPFGLTVIEAAAAGLPVVATRNGGPSDIVGTLGHGRLVDPESLVEVAGAIRALLSNREAWDAASAAGKAGIGAFDWTRWAHHAQRVHDDIRIRHLPALRPRRILACDIDNTLTGDRAAARAFADWARDRAGLGVLFAVATGRSIPEARAVLAEWDLPDPDVFITAVGTEVHMRGASGRLDLSADYAERLGRTWDRAGIIQCLQDSGATLQSPIEQRQWKLGCCGSAADARRVTEALADGGFPARVIFSHGRLIDILPANGGKAAALAFVARSVGLMLEACIAAGDSGNDIDMLNATGAGILVANALPETEGRLTGAHIHRSRLPHAAGVLDGLAVLSLMDGPARPAIAERVS